MKKTLLALILCFVSTFANAQTASQLYYKSGNNQIPVSSSSPLPIGVFDSTNHSGYCYTSNGSSSSATFQPCGSSGSSILLGTSTSSTNPHISGDLTTGLFTSGAGKVDFSISGVNRGEFSSSGLVANVSSATAIASGAITARTLAAHLADNYNAADWGAVCDGSTNDTVAFNAAGAAVSSLYAGTNQVGLIHHHGSCTVCGLRLYRNTMLVNDGGQIGVADLCSTSPPIASEGWSTNVGTAKYCGHDASVPAWFGFKDAKIDCNKSGATYTGVCIGLYGPSQITLGVNTFLNAADTWTLQTEDSVNKVNTPACQEEGHYSDMTFWGSAGGGWLYHGPKDSTIGRVIAGFNNGYGFYSEGSGGFYDATIDYMTSFHGYAGQNGNYDYLYIGGGEAVIGAVDTDGGRMSIASNNPATHISQIYLNRCGESTTGACITVASNHATIDSVIGALTSTATSTTAIRWTGQHGKLNSAQIYGDGFSGTAGSGNIALDATDAYGSYNNLNFVNFLGTTNIAIKNESGSNTFTGTLVNNKTGLADSGVGNNVVNLIVSTTSGQTAISGAPQSNDQWIINESGTSSDSYINKQRGTVSAPSLRFGGDTATGIYSRTADTVDVGIAGANVLEITSATTPFVVTSSSANTASFNSTGAHDVNILLNNQAGNQADKFIFFYNGVEKWELGSYADIHFALFDNINSHDALNVTSAGLLTLGENGQLKLPLAGNVGVGTASPSALFSVGSSSSFTVNNSGTVNSTSSITGASIGVSSGGNGVSYRPPYQSGLFFLHGPPGVSNTTTSATTMTTDKVYAVSGFAAAPVTINNVILSTSSTNASVGASVKVCVYAMGAANKPTTLLGQTTSGTAIGDGATSTTYTIALDSAVPIPAGPFFLAALFTTATTAAQMSIYSNKSFWQGWSGATSAANLTSLNPTVGWSTTNSYASGCPSPFGAATEISTTTGIPSMGFSVQ